MNPQQRRRQKQRSHTVALSLQRRGPSSLSPPQTTAPLPPSTLVQRRDDISLPEMKLAEVFISAPLPQDTTLLTDFSLLLLAKLEKKKRSRYQRFSPSKKKLQQHSKHIQLSVWEYLHKHVQLRLLSLLQCSSTLKPKLRCMTNKNTHSLRSVHSAKKKNHSVHGRRL